MFQTQGVTDFMRDHHEQVVALVPVQRPALRHVEVGLPSTGEEGVGEGAPCGLTKKVNGSEERISKEVKHWIFHRAYVERTVSLTAGIL